jgi:hypothetical protein
LIIACRVAIRIADEKGETGDANAGIKQEEDSEDSDCMIVEPADRKPSIPKRRGDRKDDDDDAPGGSKALKMFAGLTGHDRTVAMTAYYSALGSR